MYFLHLVPTFPPHDIIAEKGLHLRLSLYNVCAESESILRQPDIICVWLLEDADHWHS